MARVVPKRSGPPYLLIVFVFLFLTSTTLAALFYMNADKAKKQTAGLKDTEKTLATQSEQKDPRNEKVKADFREKTGRGKSAPTVVGHKEKLIQELVEKITGTAGDAEAALAMAKGNFEKVKADFEKAKKTFPHTGLANQIVFLNDRLIRAEEDAKEAQKVISGKDDDIVSKDTQLKKLTAEHEAKIKELADENALLGKQATAREKQHQELLEKTESAYKDTISERDRTVATLTQKVERSRLEFQKKNERIAELEKIVGDLRGPKGKLGEAPRPDGKVVRVLEDRKLCYIDIGSNDKLPVGTTFAVYPESGIPRDKKDDEGYNKAVLVVVKVGKDVAECRIVRETPGEPVIAGDLVANAAFDRNRSYTFVVHGEFDLYGKGRPSLRGNTEVRTLIKKFGGKIAEKLTVQTDFLVVGAVPVNPPVPSEDDEPHKIKAYRELREKRDRYFEIIALARNLNVPMLNTNRFVALVGFAPVEEE